MAVNKDNIIFDRRVGSAASQVVSEGEITAFEGKSEVENLLRTDGSFTMEDIQCSNNRVSFSGVLYINGMYLSGGEIKGVHCFSTELPISDYINVDGAAEGMYTYFTSNVSSLTCRVINGHKLTYRAVIDVEVTVYETAQCRYVCSVDDIPVNQQRFNRISVECVPVRVHDSITLRESLNLPMGKPNVEEIICRDVRLSSMDSKTGENSVRLSGDLNVSILYKGEGESNPMELFEESIPFKGELEAKGLTPDMLCDVKEQLKAVSVNVQPDEDGEMRMLDVDAVIEADIIGRQTREIDVLEDMYVLNKSVKFDFEEMCGCVCAARNTGQCSVKNVVTLDEKAPNMLQIYKADGKTYVDYVQINDGSIDIEGAVGVNIIYVTGNDEIPVYCFSSMLPFKHSAQAAGAGEGMECHVNAVLEHIGFNMLSDREVEVRCVINICAAAEDTRCISLISDVELEDMDSEYLGSLSSITLYIVRKGDTLWKLAKRFNTTVEDIAAINDIENPDLIYPGQRLIIVKRIA